MMSRFLVLRFEWLRRRGSRMVFGRRASGRRAQRLRVIRTGAIGRGPRPFLVLMMWVIVRRSLLRDYLGYLGRKCWLCIATFDASQTRAAPCLPAPVPSQSLAERRTGCKSVSIMDNQREGICYLSELTIWQLISFHCPVSYLDQCQQLGLGLHQKPQASTCSLDSLPTMTRHGGCVRGRHWPTYVFHSQLY